MKYFGRPVNEPVSSSSSGQRSPKPGSSIGDVPFSRAEASLSALWDTVRISAQPEHLDQFMDSFVAFDHRSKSVAGHPTDLVHRVCQIFLSFVSVDTESGFFSGEQFLLMFTREKSTRTILDVKLKVSYLQEEVIDRSASISKQDYQFIMSLHMLAKLCSWIHNRDLILSLFSVQFFTISSMILEKLIFHLEEMVMILSDSALGKPLVVLQYVKAVFSAVLALTQLVGSAGKRDKLLYLQLESMSKIFPSSVNSLREIGLDCLLQEDSAGFIDSPFPNTASESWSTREKKPKKRSVDRSLEEFLDKIIPTLQKILRKQSFLSNTLETDLQLSDSIKSSLLSMCLVCQIEAIQATSALIMLRPVLASDFLASDSIRFLRPYVTPKMPAFLGPSIAYELYFMRAICVVRLCGIGLSNPDSSFNADRWVEETSETLESLEPLIHFIMDNAQMESSSLAQGEGFSRVDSLKISCSCSTKLSVKLPASGMHPWDENTGSSAQFASFMAGEQLESDVALTEPLTKFWRYRSNSIPTNDSYLYDPSKSFLGARIGKIADASLREKMLGDPIELVDKLISSKSLVVFFDIILLSKGYPAYQTICEAILGPMLNCINLYKAASIPGVILMQSMFRFLFQSLELNKTATLSASRSTELWSKVLEVLLPPSRSEFDRNDIAGRLQKFLTVQEDESSAVLHVTEKRGSPSSSHLSSSRAGGEMEESKIFKLQLLTIDCALELLWLFSAQKLITSMSGASSSGSKPGFDDHEELQLVKFLKIHPSSFSVMIITRWLANYAILHSQMGLKSAFWLEVVSCTHNCLKNLMDPSLRPAHAAEVDIFLWPSTYSCLRLLGKIFYDDLCSNWLDFYLYLDEMPYIEGQDQKVNKAKIIRSHLFFRTMQYSACRNFSVGLLMRLMYVSASGASSNIEVTNGYDYEYRHRCEALFHDCLKYILNMIRNHGQEAFVENHLLSIKTLYEGLKLLIRRPSIFSIDKDHAVAVTAIQELFVRYGPARLWHRNIFTWTKSRYYFIRDWLLCLEAIILLSKNANSSSEVILSSLPFISALLLGNEKLQEMFTSTSSIKGRKTSVSEGGDAHRHELCLLIISSLPGREEDSTIFFAPLLEMLLGTMPVKLQQVFRTNNDSGIVGKRLVDGENQLVTHGFVLQILIPLLPCWSEQWQVFALDTILQLLQGTWTSVSNLLSVTSMKPSLLELVLEVFHYLAGSAKVVSIKLLKHLGKFSVSVAELKKLIRSLKDAEKVQTSTDFLAEILSSSMSASMDPQFYFYFEGRRCGIKLPVFQRWPGVGGFSFATWFAVEWAANECTEMTLFNLRQKDGVGFELYLKKDAGIYSNAIEVAYAIYNGKGVEPVEYILAKFQLDNFNGKWHYIGFTHNKGLKFIKKSHTQIVLDEESSSMDVPFPRLTFTPTYACIGSSHPIRSAKAPFHGQMTSVYLFQAPLATKALLQLKMLTFRRFHEVPSITEGNRDLGLDATISESLVLAYNPGVEINGVLLNNVPDYGNSIFSPLSESGESTSELAGVRSQMNGILIEGTYVSTSSDIRNALDSLGGIKVILPMFEQLEQNFSKSQHSLLCQMLRLLTNALNTTIETKRFMIQSGFSCLRYLLERYDASLLQASIVDELQLLQEKFEGDHQWNEAIFTCIYLDFSLWVRTPYNTQERLLAEVEKFCRTRSSKLQADELVRKLFQAASVVFSSSVSSRVSSMSRSDQYQVFHRGSIVGTLTDMELKTLRAFLFSAVYYVVSSPGNLNENNVTAILNYIVAEVNPTYKIEGMLLLLKLVNPEKPKHASSLLSVLTSTRGLMTISHLCGHPRAKVRLFAWIVICNLLQLGLLTEQKSNPADAKRPQQDTEAQDQTHDSSHQPQMYGLDSNSLASLLLTAAKTSLSTAGLTDKSVLEYEYSATFHMLLITMFGFSTKYMLQSLDKVSMPHSDDMGHEDPSDENSKAENLPVMSLALREHRICIPMIFPVLLEMLGSKLCPASLRNRHFTELFDSLQSYENVDIITSIPHFLACILDLYIAVRSHTSNSSLTDRRFSRDVRSKPAHDSLSDFAYTIAGAIGQLHLIIIQFGEAKRMTYQIHQRGPVNCRPYMEVSTLDLFEIVRKDQRSLGCGTVRKTVSYLRSYVTRGLLTYDGFCFIVLRILLEGLTSTISSVKASILDRVEKEMRFKILEMNVWFILEAICQYLVLPPIQPVQSHARRDLMSIKSPDIRRAATEPTEFFLGELQDADESGDILRGMHRLRSQSDAVPVALESNSDKSRGVIPPVSTVDAEESPQSLIHKVGSDEVNAFDFLSETISAHDENFWIIIESLTSLLGIGDGLQGSWLSRDRLVRLEAAMKVGINRGRIVVNLVQDSVESLLHSELEVQSSDVGRSTDSKSQRSPQKYFLEKVIDRSLWLLMRAILNLALQGATESGELTESSSSIQAVLKLSTVLHWTRTATKNSFDSESLYVLAKFSKTLDETMTATNPLWTRFVMKLLVEIITAQKSTLANNLELIIANPSTAAAAGTAGLSLKQSTSFVDLFSLSGKQSTVVSPRSAPESPLAAATSALMEERSVEADDLSRSSLTSSNVSFSDSFPSGVAQYLLSKLQACCDKNKNTRLTWDQWMNFVKAVIEEAARQEDAAMKSRLDDLGFHKQTEDITILILNHTRFLSDEQDIIIRKLEQLIHKIVSSEQKLMREYVRNDVLSLKNAEKNWFNLRDELCNERGPWGSGNWGNDEVSWTIDQAEERSRMKKKLVRSGVHKSYVMDFLNKRLSEEGEETIDVRPKRTAEEDQAQVTSTLDLLLPAGDSRQENEDDMEERPALSDLGFNLSILRDLHQYRAESSSQSGKNDDLDPDEDDDDIEELGEESLSTQDAPSTMGDANPLDAHASHQDSDILFSAACEVITPSTNSMSLPSAGLLQITRTKVTFTKASEASNGRSSLASVQSTRTRKDESLACDTLWACQLFPSTQWDVAEICNVLLRYYQLRFVAAEIFTTSRRVVFFNLMDQKTANKFHATLRRLKPPHMAPMLGRRPSTIITRTLAPGSLLPLSEAWANREISNFDYLMRLNTIAGRTFNDLGQYPIFPWILADYTSETLNLKDRNTFRDLLWPIGAQIETQRNMLKSKYNDLLQAYEPEEEVSLPPFHYGTHYSVAGFVVWYLMRCEPYTSLHIQLQDGRIDRADRLFDSLGAAWKGCTTNPSDAKELVPELFFNPDVLVNVNDVDFGTTQSHRKINHIALPPWAKDPHDFIMKHREALESEYVSRHLHLWIDLVFGYKQRPPHIPGGSEAAVKACNVFFHLTYENAVDLEKLKESNPALYTQYVCQITEFGQTPSQLFFKEHVARTPLHKADIIWPIASIVRGVHTVYEPEEEPFGMPRKMLCFKSTRISHGPILMIVDAEDKLLTVDYARVFGCHPWQVTSHDAVPPFRLKIDPLLQDIARGDGGTLSARLSFAYGKGGTGKERKIGVPFAPERKSAAKSDRSAKDDIKIAAKSVGTNDVGGSGKLWKPARVKNYERDEKNLTLRRQLAVPVVDREQLEYLRSALSSPVASSTQQRPTDRITPSHDAVTLNLPSTLEKERERSGTSLSSLSVSSAGINFEPTRTQRPRAASSHHSSQSANSTSVPSKRRPSHHATSTPSTPSSATKEGVLPAGNTSSMLTMSSTYSTAINAKVQDEHLSARNFAYLEEASLLFSCGHWDWSVRVTSADSGKLLQILTQHHDVVTCLAVAKDFGNRWLVTGSRDCTVIIWEISIDRNQLSSVHPIRTLYGHDESVTCVAIHPELDIVVSGSEDGTWIMHNLRDGKYVRTVGNFDQATSNPWKLVPERASTFPQTQISNQSTSFPFPQTSSVPPRPVSSSESTEVAAVAHVDSGLMTGLKQSGSDGNMTERMSSVTRDDTASTSEASTAINPYQPMLPPPPSGGIIAPIATTPRRPTVLPPSIIGMESPGDEMPGAVGSGIFLASLDRPATTTPSLAPDAILGARTQHQHRGSINYGSGVVGVPASATASSSAIGGSSSPSGITGPAVPSLRNQFWKVTWVGISKEGYVITYSAEQQRLTTFTINGVFIASKRVPECLYCFALSEDGAVLVTGGSACLVAFRWVHSLELANDGPRLGLECLLDSSTADYLIEAFPSPIRSLHLTRQERHLLVGLETGELRVLAHDSDYLRARLHRKLQELGIL